MNKIFQGLLWGSNLNRFRLPLLALCSATYVFVFVCRFTCHYVTNDSTLIMEYTRLGLPIAYIGLPLSGLLHIAYSAAPNAPWYAISLYIAHVISVLVWLWLLFRVFRPWWLAGAFSIVFLTYYLEFLVNLDYTSTAVMLCAASVIWAMLEVMERTPGYWRILGSGLLFLLGWLVRPQVPLGALAYALPLALMAALWSLRGRILLHDTRVRPQAPVGAAPYAVPLAWMTALWSLRPRIVMHEIRWLALVLLVFFAPTAINIAGDTAYRHLTDSPQQIQFDTFNSVRGKLVNGLSEHQKDRVINDKGLLAATHWTYNEVSYLFGWEFLDERTDSVPRLQTLLDGVPPKQVSSSEFIGEIIAWLSRPRYIARLLYCSMPFSLLILLRRPWLGCLGLLAPLYCVALSSYMYLYFLFLGRVSFPFTIGFGFSVLLICGAIAAKVWNDKNRAFLLIALISAALGWMGSRIEYGHQMYVQLQLPARAAATRQKLDTLNRDFGGQVILIQPAGALPLDDLSPLETYQTRFRSIELGWNTFSPLFYRQISALGIDHGYQIVDAMISNPKAYVLGKEPWCYALLAYATRHDNKQINVVKVRQFSDGTGLYRFEYGGKK